MVNTSACCWFLVLVTLCVVAQVGCMEPGIHNNRPPPNERKFVSKAVDDFLDMMQSKMIDSELAEIFVSSMPNTLDTTLIKASREDSFVITGDINAMWLRDSTFQVMPYIQFMQNDPNLTDAICGLINRQARSILMDPYANAFNEESNGGGHQTDRRIPPMSGDVYEGKYELDSLIAFLKLSRSYHEYSRDVSCFQMDWFNGISMVLDILEEQQKGTDEEDTNPPYSFWRSEGCLSNNGRGPPAKRTGMVKSAFRPSDDATMFPFNIPVNEFAHHELKRLSGILFTMRKGGDLRNLGLEEVSESLADRASAIAADIKSGIKAHGIANHPFEEGIQILAYEVDGFGNQNLMDDANAPSLLSLSYLQCGVSDSEIYNNTRRFVFNETNPYFFRGIAGYGVGGPHVGYGYIWPLSIIYYLMGSDDDSEILEGLDVLRNSSAGTGFMHESFWKDDANNFTRSWFAWANSAFGELILQLLTAKPHLIVKDHTNYNNK